MKKIKGEKKDFNYNAGFIIENYKKLFKIQKNKMKKQKILQ